MRVLVDQLLKDGQGAAIVFLGRFESRQGPQDLGQAPMSAASLEANVAVGIGRLLEELLTKAERVFEQLAADLIHLWHVGQAAIAHARQKAIHGGKRLVLVGDGEQTLFFGLFRAQRRCVSLARALA